VFVWVSDSKVRGAGNCFFNDQNQKRFASLRLHATFFFQELKKKAKKPWTFALGSAIELVVYGEVSHLRLPFLYFVAGKLSNIVFYSR